MAGPAEEHLSGITARAGGQDSSSQQLFQSHSERGGQDKGERKREEGGSGEEKKGTREGKEGVREEEHKEEETRREEQEGGMRRTGKRVGRNAVARRGRVWKKERTRGEERTKEEK